MEAFINVIGFSAALLVAGSLLPQIWRAHKRGSAEDLSFFWQGTVAAGLSLQLVYLYHYGMWAVFFPLLSELAFILYLAGLKLYFEHSLCGFGRGGGDRPFVGKKMAGVSSSSDDYSVLGGGAGGSSEGTSLDSSGTGAGGWGGLADGDEGGGGIAATGFQELEGAEKGRRANTGDEGASQPQAL